MQRPAYSARPMTALLAAAMLATLTAICAPVVCARAGTVTPGTGTSGYAMTPNSPSDIYVPGKYNRDGIYVPPHYVPKPKPAFSAFNNRDTKKHGYFDLKKPAQPQHEAN